MTEETLNPLEEASSSDTTPERLAELASHPDEAVKKAVIANPNSPLPVIFQLLEDNPPLVTLIPDDTLCRILGDSSLPHPFLLALLQHKPVSLLKAERVDLWNDIFTTTAPAQLNLSSAVLARASLVGVILEGANLGNANLQGANLENAKKEESQPDWG